MIKTSRHLKALVRNLSKGDSTKAQIIIRHYVMERFLERLAVSQYRDNFILKGGILIAAMVGIDNRSTLDIDTTIKNLTLSEENARKIVEDIANISLEDGMSFEIMRVDSIMDDAEYSGIRVTVEAHLEMMRTLIKIDFSTGDTITPKEIAYLFKLLFEERSISLWTYNIETVLAEKFETLLSRATANTRMRDFYDIFALGNTQWDNIDKAVLKMAFSNTVENRGSLAVVADMDLILNEVEHSDALIALWASYQHKFDYASEISWNDVMVTVKKLYDAIK